MERISLISMVLGIAVEINGIAVKINGIAVEINGIAVEINEIAVEINEIAVEIIFFIIFEFKIIIKKRVLKAPKQ